MELLSLHYVAFSGFSVFESNLVQVFPKIKQSSFCLIFQPLAERIASDPIVSEGHDQAWYRQRPFFVPRQFLVFLFLVKF